MANFEAYQEYQRIEDFEESPPGEEDLLVHVPEGLRGTLLITSHHHPITVDLIVHVPEGLRGTLLITSPHNSCVSTFVVTM